MPHMRMHVRVQVALSEEHIAQMYQAFMLVYVDEADEATLESLGIDEVDDATLGFAEMMSIKLGELIDQPRHVRVQAASRMHAYGSLPVGRPSAGSSTTSSHPPTDAIHPCYLSLRRTRRRWPRRRSRRRSGTRRSSASAPRRCWSMRRGTRTSGSF